GVNRKRHACGRVTLLWTARSVADGAIGWAAHRSLTGPPPRGTRPRLVTDGRGPLTPPTGCCYCQILKKTPPRPPREWRPWRPLWFFSLRGRGRGGLRGGHALWSCGRARAKSAATAARPQIQQRKPD